VNVGPIFDGLSRGIPGREGERSGDVEGCSVGCGEGGKSRHGAVILIFGHWGDRGRQSFEGAWGFGIGTMRCVEDNRRCLTAIRQM